MQPLRSLHQRMSVQLTPAGFIQPELFFSTKTCSAPRWRYGDKLNSNLHLQKVSLSEQEKPTTSRFVGRGERRVISFARFFDSSEPHSRVNTVEARWEPRQQLYDSQIVG